MTQSNQALAKRLKLAREQAGLSQGQAAKLMNMHRPTISEIEAGRRGVKAEELTEFAKHFHVAVPWLLGEGGDDAEPHEAKLRLVARELAQLKPDDLDRVLNVLASLRRDDTKQGRKR